MWADPYAPLTADQIESARVLRDTHLARVRELESVLRDATKFIDYPGRFDGVERLALASRCRLALKGESAK